MEKQPDPTRRKFIFGLGAFAAGIFIPVKKLYFPVAENPAVFDPGGFSMPSIGLDSEPTFLWMVTERIPTKVGPKGYSEVMRLHSHWRERVGSSPESPHDGERTKGTFLEALERANLPGAQYNCFESWDAVYYKV